MSTTPAFQDAEFPAETAEWLTYDHSDVETQP